MLDRREFLGLSAAACVGWPFDDSAHFAKQVEMDEESSDSTSSPSVMSSYSSSGGMMISIRAKFGGCVE